MSVPVSAIRCSKCSFTQGQRLPTRRVYKYDDCLVNIPWEQAWCYECNTIVASESFMNATSFRAQLDELKHTLLSMKEEYIKVIPDTNYVYLKPMPKQIMISTDNAFQLSKIVHDLKAIERRLDCLSESHLMTIIVSLRQSQPKCLDCGCTNISQVEICRKEEIQSKGSAIHPRCGGILYDMDDEDGLRISWNLNNTPTRIYDIEGNYIGTKEEP